MTVIFGILGILCLIYYGVIVIYSGAGTSFSAIWIVLALGFFIMAAVGKFYLIGGFQPATEREECYLPLDILCYDPVDNRWTEGDAAPAAFVGSAAVALNDSVCVIAGGVDAEIFRAAVNNPLWQRQARLEGDHERLARLQREQKEYMKHAPGWYRFNRRLIAGRVVVNDRIRLTVVNGESKPGIRSAGVYGIEFGEEKQ